MMQWSNRIRTGPAGCRHRDAVGRLEPTGSLDHLDPTLLGHGRESAGELGDDLLLAGAHLVQIDLGSPKVTPMVPSVLTSSRMAAVCSSALEGMQPTFRQTPPSVS